MTPVLDYLDTGLPSTPAIVQAAAPSVVKRYFESYSTELASGTRVQGTTDLRAALKGTWNGVVRYELLPRDPRETVPTRMDRLDRLADLSLREWGAVFGVSPQAIRNWKITEPPERRELNEALDLLVDARRRHPELGLWLKRPLREGGEAPINFLARKQWGAFRSASRLTPTVAPLDTAVSARLRARSDRIKSFRGPEPELQPEVP